MATADAFCWIHDFSLIIIVWLIVTTPAAKYCYHGFHISSPYTLDNQLCATGEVHLFKTLIENEQETSPTYVEDEIHNHFVEDGILNRDSASIKNSHCFIFRNVATQTIFHDVQRESVHMEFGCDFSNICDNKELNTVLYQETVNGSQGQLFCCDKENCNKVSELPHLPIEDRVCYHGSMNKSDTTTAERMLCAYPDIMCAKTTTYFPDGKVESYFCDNDKLCQNKMEAGSFRSCYTTLVDNTTTHELCCCDTSLCFVPPDVEGKSTNVSISHILSPRTVDKLTVRKDERFAMTGLIVVLVFVCGIVGGVMFTMVCKKRRQPRPDPDLIMQYERLSALDVDMDVAVIL